MLGISPNSGTSSSRSTRSKLSRCPTTRAKTLERDPCPKVRGWTVLPLPARARVCAFWRSSRMRLTAVAALAN